MPDDRHEPDRLELLREQLKPTSGDWQRAYALAEANANRDREAVAGVLAEAIEAGDQPRLVALIVAYLAVLPPPRLALVQAARLRATDAVFDNIVADFGDQSGDDQ